MWGQAFHLARRQLKRRIIPTRMGTSCEEKNKYRLTWDHPHACGDKLISDLSEDGFSGSSPRVWGQAVSTFPMKRTSRIIPTRVGTSPFRSECVRGFEDHPHACGDKCYIYLFGCNLKGSSPRVWGQVSILSSAISLRRIIPTRVGTRRFRRRMPRCSWDHPHACGDKAASYLQCPITIGSSPRVWGQVSSIATYNFEARIIPTRVGTSVISISLDAI